MKPYLDEDGKLNYQPWVKHGDMLYSREGLNPNDPDHLYNYLKEVGFEPERFGIKHPYDEMFAGKSRGELIAEVIDLREQLESAARHGFY